MSTFLVHDNLKCRAFNTNIHSSKEKIPGDLFIFLSFFGKEPQNYSQKIKVFFPRPTIVNDFPLYYDSYREEHSQSFNDCNRRSRKKHLKIKIVLKSFVHHSGIFKAFY